MSTGAHETIIDGAVVPLDVVIPALETEMGTAAIDNYLTERFAGLGDSVLSICVLEGARPLCEALQEGQFGRTVQPVFTEVQFSTRREGIGAPGRREIIKPLGRAVTGLHVVTIEDLIDTGETLGPFLEDLANEAPASLTVVSLLNKAGARTRPLPEGITYRTAFLFHEDLWATGAGMDIDGKHREGWAVRAPRTQIQAIPFHDRYEADWPHWPKTQHMA